MFTKRLLVAGLLATAVLGFAPETSSAQNCGSGNCGPVIGGAGSGLGCSGGGCVGNGVGLFRRDRFTLFPRPNGNQPACATRSYPLSDWAFIRKYCGPSIIPGSCYGYYQTQWRKWENICPGSASLDDTGCAPGMPGAAYAPGMQVAPGMQFAPVVLPATPVVPGQPGQVPSVPLPNPIPVPIPKTPSAQIDPYTGQPYAARYPMRNKLEENTGTATASFISR